MRPHALSDFTFCLTLLREGRGSPLSRLCGKQCSGAQIAKFSTTASRAASDYHITQKQRQLRHAGHHQQARQNYQHKRDHVGNDSVQRNLGHRAGDEDVDPEGRRDQAKRQVHDHDQAVLDRVDAKWIGHRSWIGASTMMAVLGITDLRKITIRSVSSISR